MIGKLKKLKLKDNKLLSLSTLGAVLFALSLWVYTSLNDIYITPVEIPLKILLPDNRSPENRLPTEVTVFARGNGWDLFNLLFFNQKKECIVDLSSEDITSSEYTIENQTLQKSFRNIVNNIVADEVYPQSIDIKTGLSVEKKVPIKNRITVIPDEEFVLANKTEFFPDTVIVKGNAKIINKLSYWPTENIQLENVNKPLTEIIKLKDTLNTIASINLENTTAYIDIQQLAELTIYDVEIEFDNRAKGNNEFYSSDKIDITIRGGVNELTKLKLESIRAIVDPNISEAEQIVRPRIVIPDNFEVVELSPRYIYKYTYRSRLTELR